VCTADVVGISGHSWHAITCEMEVVNVRTAFVPSW
jgi:hypothetical protein